MKTHHFLVAICLSLACSCTSFFEDKSDDTPKTKLKNAKIGDSKDKANQKTRDTTVVTKTDEKSGVKTVLSMVDGDKNGFSKQYYASGEIWKKTQYSDGVINGVAEIFYKSGKTKRRVEYSQGKKNGKYQEFYKSGNIKTEINYDMNLPLLGTIEIDYTKKKIKNPLIKVRQEDLLYEDRYNYYFSLEPNMKDAEFYVMDKKEEWNSNANLSVYNIGNNSKGENMLPIPVAEGYYFVKTIHIYVKYKTKKGNDAVVYKSINVAIENY